MTASQNFKGRRQSRDRCYLVKTVVVGSCTPKRDVKDNETRGKCCSHAAKVIKDSEIEARDMIWLYQQTPLHLHYTETRYSTLIIKLSPKPKCNSIMSVIISYISLNSPITSFGNFQVGNSSMKMLVKLNF
jgi:hypothetical protein